MREITTTGAKQTQKIASLLAEELTRASRPVRDGACVISLMGDLGAGKTTFAQGVARALGVKERVLSPTFVLMKIYALKKKKFRHLIHIDCYRLASPRDLAHLGFKEILKDKDAVILIEWADRIKKILPPHTLWLKFSHGAKAHQRSIVILWPLSF